MIRNEDGVNSSSVLTSCFSAPQSPLNQRVFSPRMTKIVNFGLIGTGGIGAYHRAAIETHAEAGLAKLVAVADPTIGEDKIAEFRSKGIHWHADYREMLEQETLDAVVIATPIPFHLEMTKACLARGLFVNLEKPPVPLLGQLEALISADPRNTVNVGFQMIGAASTQALKRLISEGLLGKILSIRAAGCWPRLDGYYGRARWAGKMSIDGAPIFDGPATNALAHVIHTIMYCAGETHDTFSVPSEVTGELYRARRIESYDTACLKGRFPSDIAFSLAVTHATENKFPFSIQVKGTLGSATLSEDGARLESSVGVSLDREESTQQLLDINYTEFLKVLSGERARFPSTLRDTRGYVETTNAILLSSGGIHDIPMEFIREYRQGEEAGFDVTGLREAVLESLSNGRLFSAQGCSWAKGSPWSITLPLDSATPLPGLT